MEWKAPYVNGAGTPLQAFTYSYDETGNRKTVEDSYGTRTTYTYDAKARLTKDETTGTVLAHVFTYAYDPADNRTLSTESGVAVTSTYDFAGRLTTSTDGLAYAYDTNGNLTTVTSGGLPITMQYDKENRLTVHKQGGTVRTYTYDGDGRKRTENNPGFTTIIWDGEEYLQGRS